VFVPGFLFWRLRPGVGMLCAWQQRPLLRRLAFRVFPQGVRHRGQVLKSYVYQELLSLQDRLVNPGVAILRLAHAARH
jgi:hypothetical protein